MAKELVIWETDGHLLLTEDCMHSLGGHYVINGNWFLVEMPDGTYRGCTFNKTDRGWPSIPCGMVLKLNRSVPSLTTALTGECC